MGYVYEHSGGNARLMCDACGGFGGVRKRHCKYKVRDERGAALSYCPAPAMCRACYLKAGGLSGVHGESCRTGAAAAQVIYDRKRERLLAGDMDIGAAWGDWHPSVPPGKVGVFFRGLGGAVSYRLMAQEDYRRRETATEPVTLQWFEQQGVVMEPWSDPAMTKRVEMVRTE